MDNLEVLKAAANGDKNLLKRLKDNLLRRTIFAIISHRGGAVTFTEIQDFWKVEVYEKMELDMQRLYDFWCDFYSVSHSANVLMDIAVEKTTFSLSHYNSRIDAPQKVKAATDKELHKVDNFADFIALLDEEQLETLKSYATERSEKLYRGLTVFEQYRIATKADKFSKGQNLVGWNINNQRTGMQIVQVEEGSFIYAIDSDTDRAYCVVETCKPQTPQEAGIDIPKDITDEYDANHKKFVERQEGDKADRLGIRGKKMEAEAKAEKEFAKKAKKAGKTVEEYREHLENLKAEREAHSENWEAFEKIDLSTQEGIEKAGEQLSQEDFLSKSKRKKANKLIREAKKALKAENAETETVETETEAEA